MPLHFQEATGMQAGSIRQKTRLNWIVMLMKTLSM